MKYPHRHCWFCAATYFTGQARRLIQQFGQAKLVRLHNGRHELVGGKTSDLIAAQEWASLFAHEIVFSPKCVASRT